ncbi:hypothetical protein [Kaistella sp.]|uniref:hypothetical protein n=1 Tax=Kaistella sp. TaxID=2782235 RepID=UPI002F95CC8B
MNQFVEKYFEKAEESERKRSGLDRLRLAANDSSRKKAIKILILFLPLLLALYFLSVITVLLIAF